MSDSTLRFIGLTLNPGVNRGHMASFYAGCFSMLMLATFVPQTQPFLLEEVLQLDSSKQGVISGNLNFWGEMVIILTVGLWGSLSDRVGRRGVTAIGFLLIAVGVVFYGVARDITGLWLARGVYSAGIAAVSTMVVTLIGDYISNPSRGKASGFMGVMNGLGAVATAMVLLKLPGMFQGQGMDAAEAAWATYGSVALGTACIALIMFLGLRKGRAIAQETRTPLLQQLREGMGEARRPVIALAYSASFVARGNMAVVGTFFTLWASVYGTTQLGMGAAEAVGKGGAILGISYVASLLSAPFFGILADRFHRLSALAVTLAISAVGYSATYFLDDPFSGATIACLIVIGMAEVGCAITSGVLIAEQAPEHLRGSVVGLFTLSGAVGILIASVVGGYLFDHWLKTGPFVFFGLVASIVLVWALLLRAREQ